MRNIAASVAAFALVASASPALAGMVCGKDITEAEIAKIVVGKTTKKEIKTMFDCPQPSMDQSTSGGNTPPIMGIDGKNDVSYQFNFDKFAEDGKVTKIIPPTKTAAKPATNAKPAQAAGGAKSAAKPAAQPAVKPKK